MNVTILAACAACRANAPRFCQSHTCIDCGLALTDVEGHKCAKTDDDRDRMNRRVALRITMLNP